MRAAFAGLLLFAACAQAPLERPAFVTSAPVPLVLEVGGAVTATLAVSLLELSVEQALMLALEHNRDLRTRQLGPVVAGTFEAVERAVFDPELFAEARYFQERAVQTARATGERFEVEGRNTQAALGVRQRLPTGTTLEASLGHRFDISDRTPEQQEARLNLTVTQSLLRGFGTGVNLAAVRQGELELAASVHELRGFTEVLLAETEMAYWRFVAANEELAILERARDVALREAEELQERIAVGLAPELDLAAARAEVARRSQGLIDGKSAREGARLRLVRLVNPAPSGDLGVPVTAVSQPQLAAKAVDDGPERLQLAERYRPELAEARLRLSQNRLQLVVTRNGLLPRLDLFVALGKTGFDDSVSGSFRALTQNTYDVLAGLSFSQLLGNRAGDAIDLAGRARARQAEEAVESLRQQVRLEVYLALNELERARQQIEATRITREMAEATATAERERFEVGHGTALQVAQAQRDLLASQLEEVRAVVAYRIALVRLYLAEGTLLARRGITVEAS